jgi:hypothetical protein
MPICKRALNKISKISSCPGIFEYLNKSNLLECLEGERREDRYFHGYGDWKKPANWGANLAIFEQGRETLRSKRGGAWGGLPIHPQRESLPGNG